MTRASLLCGGVCPMVILRMFPIRRLAVATFAILVTHFAVAQTYPGDIQTYGYQDEIMLIQEITPPSKIDSSPVKLSAQADWLVCEKICIPGSAALGLELPTSTTAQPKNTDLFARYRRLVPQDFPD